LSYEDDLNIYTDGSSKSHPRLGGIGVMFVYVDQNTGEEITESPTLPGYKGATSNEMELKACIEGLKLALHRGDLARFNKIVTHSDSQYLCDHANDAMWKWQKNGWITSVGAPVLNVPLWKEINHLRQKLWRMFHKKVEFNWVKGHSKNQYNRQAHTLADASALSPSNERISIVIARRKKTKSPTKKGSVKMQGQRVSIHIIQGQYLNEHRLFRYRYEIISESSKFHGKVDFIFSKHALRERHCYRVGFNRNQGNPMILRVYNEILLDSPKVAADTPGAEPIESEKQVQTGVKTSESNG
jgi:ribonuclease HI